MQRKLFLFAALLTSLLSNLVYADTTLTLVYTGNLDGELEPCGCSAAGDLGGIKRQVNMLDQLRAKTPDLIAISTGGFLVSEMPQDRLKSIYILRGAKELNYDAIGVQGRDLGYGAAFLREGDLPWVASNVNGVAHIDTERIITRGARRVAFLQWLDADIAATGTALTLNTSADTLSSRLRELNEQGVLTVLGTTMTLEQAQKLLPLKDVDILLIKSKYEEYGEPQRVENTLVLQPGSRGMRLGEVELRLDDQGKIADWKHEVIALPKDIGDAPRMEKWYAEYNEQVKLAYEARVAMRKDLQNRNSPYSGADTCKSCHKSAYDAWQKSKHSHAFSALERVNKTFDPECLTCHTTGFEKNGYIDAAFTPDLQNVQCENCHGAAKDHAGSAGKIPTPHHEWSHAQICAQCHNQKRSPDFDLEKRWPLIAHGKDKMKTKKKRSYRMPAE